MSHDTVTGPDLTPEDPLLTWSVEDLVREVERLRALVGLDERSYEELSRAVLALRDHNRGLAAELGELRSKDLWTDEFETATNRHIKNLERHVKSLELRLNKTIDWANDVDAHAKRVQAWADEIDAHRAQLLADQGPTLDKAAAYDRWMSRRSFRLLLRLRSLVTRRPAHG